MEDLNITIFLALNAPPSPPGWTVLLARICAEDLVFIVAAVSAALWIWGSGRGRGALLAVGTGLLLACAISTTLSVSFYHPRPFAAGIGQTLIDHAPDSSFPSDHATFLWTVGLGLIATGAWRAWGAAVVALGAATAWARVYLGVHFPFDMAGSFLIASASAGVARILQPWITERARPAIESLYEAVLNALRLPATVFPRRVR